MNLSLTAIECEAFKNFAAKTRLSLADLAPGLHRVTGENRTNGRLGSNGSGKSTLFSDAISWCWFGRTVGGLKTTDVRSWLIEKPPRVATTICVNGAEHIVQRGPKATALTLDGKVVGQADVESLLGFGYEAFEQAIVWGQSRPLFLDLRPGDKMALLAGALGLARWDARAEAASARARRLEASLAALDGELKGLETAREHAEAALETAKAAQSAWGADHAARLEKLRADLEKAVSAALSAEEERGKADLGAEVGLRAGEAKAAAEGARTRLRDAESSSANIRRELGGLAEREDALDEKLTSFEESKCPECGQPVKKTEAARRTRELRAEMDAVRTKRRELQEDLGKTEDTAVLLRDEVDEASVLLTELEKEERAAQQVLLTWERRTAETRAARNALQDELDRTEAETNPHRDAAADAKKRLREIDVELKAGDEKAEKLEASAERAKFWAKGFRDIRMMVVDEVLDDLRATTATVLEDLGLGEWEIDYSTERETKSGTTRQELAASVRAPGAPEGVKWESYSGGEGQRLRLASALALGEVLLAHAGVRCDFRVLDEPTRGLSTEGVRDLTEMLAAYAEEAGLRLFYVDHTSQDGLTFASTITIVNDENGAYVRVEE